MKKPKVVSSTNLFRGYVDLNQDLLEKSDGERLHYTYFSLAADAVVILALTPDGKFLLTREYRHPLGSTILGCPGGKLEKGEDPLQGGRRELLEETGYDSKELSLIGISHQIPALSNQKVYFLLAKNVSFQGAQKLDPFELITPEIKTEEEIRLEASRGAILDGHLLAALSFHRFSYIKT